MLETGKGSESSVELPGITAIREMVKSKGYYSLTTYVSAFLFL